MRFAIQIVLLLTALLITFTARAETKTIVELGLSYGGDILTPEISNARIRAGSGVKILLGIEEFLGDDRNSSLAAGFGFKGNASLTSCFIIFCFFGGSSEAYFRSFILDAIYQFKIGEASNNSGQHWLGIGISHHLSPEYEYDSFFGAAAGTENYDDAMALVLQYSLRDPQKSHLSIGFRYTQVEFESSDIFGKTVDGGNIMLFMTGGF